MNLLAFGTCTAAGSLAFGWVWARARGREGLPFLVFTGFYVLTTVIGASLLQFDPRLVALFLAHEPEFYAIRATLPDPAHAG